MFHSGALHLRQFLAIAIVAAGLLSACTGPIDLVIPGTLSPSDLAGLGGTSETEILRHEGKTLEPVLAGVVQGTEQADLLIVYRQLFGGVIQVQRVRVSALNSPVVVWHRMFQVDDYVLSMDATILDDSSVAIVGSWGRSWGEGDEMPFVARVNADGSIAFLDKTFWGDDAASIDAVASAHEGNLVAGGTLFDSPSVRRGFLLPISMREHGVGVGAAFTVEGRLDRVSKIRDRGDGSHVAVLNESLEWGRRKSALALTHGASGLTALYGFGSYSGTWQILDVGLMQGDVFVAACNQSDEARRTENEQSTRECGLFVLDDERLMRSQAMDDVMARNGLSYFGSLGCSKSKVYLGGRGLVVEADWENPLVSRSQRVSGDVTATADAGEAGVWTLSREYTAAVSGHGSRGSAVYLTRLPE